MEQKKKATTPFVLAGSIRTELTDEELEAALLESRRAAHAAAEAKFQQLLEPGE